jgi:hypothetical protein
MKISLLLILFLLTNLGTGFCQTTYTSLANGNWNNSSTVWSTNGSSPCGCTPGYILVNDTVIINHDINLGNNLEADFNSHVLINSTGSLSGNNAIETINGGSIVAFGPIDCDEIEVGPGCIGNFYQTINCAGRFRVEGISQVDTTVIASDIEVKETGILTFVVQYIEVSVENGEFKNDGIINFNNTCLYILHGDFRNKETGSLFGNGYIEVQDGDIRDDPASTWPISVNWCCSGEEEDMPFAENCNGCLLILPLDLVAFWGTTTDQKIILHWITATEINTHYYVVERSLNAIDWKEIGSVEGIPYALTNSSYTFHDQELPAEKTLYYRTGNVNLDGVVDYSPVIAVENPNVLSISQGYYNIYGHYFPSLETAPSGIYIEITTSGNRMVFHQQ